MENLVGGKFVYRSEGERYDEINVLLLFNMGLQDKMLLPHVVFKMIIEANMSFERRKLCHMPGS